MRRDRERNEQQEDKNRQYWREQRKNMKVTGGGIESYSEERLSQEEAKCRQEIASMQQRVAEKSKADRWGSAEKNKEMWHDQIQSDTKVIEDRTYLLEDIQHEMQRRRTAATVTQVTAMALATQKTGTTSTEKTQTVSTADEQRLTESIKAREAQMEKWKWAIWPSDWVTIGTSNAYEKVTQAEREKLASIQKARWEGPRDQLHKHEAEKHEENSKKMTENRNNGGRGNGGGDKKPDKDPLKPVKDGLGAGAVDRARKEKPFKNEPQKIDPEKNRPNHETGKPLEWHEQEAKKKHIWRNEGGHVPKETETAKDMFNDIVQKPENHLGQNKAGNQVYAGPNKIDGKQGYVKVREGKVENAGVNDKPWTKEQVLGTETPPKDRGNSNQYVIIGGGLGAIASSSESEAAEIKERLNAPVISTNTQELKLPASPSPTFTLPEAPASSKPHFTTQPNEPFLSSGLDMSKIPKIDFTKSPTGAISNQENVFSLSPSTLSLLNKTSSSSSTKPSDSKPSVSTPTFSLPSAPAASKPYVPSSYTSSTPSSSTLKLPSSDLATI